jgi:hypothetical protein
VACGATVASVFAPTAASAGVAMTTPYTSGTTSCELEAYSPTASGGQLTVKGAILNAEPNSGPCNYNVTVSLYKGTANGNDVSLVSSRTTMLKSATSSSMATLTTACPTAGSGKAQIYVTTVNYADVPPPASDTDTTWVVGAGASLVC